MAPVKYSRSLRIEDEFLPIISEGFLSGTHVFCYAEAADTCTRRSLSIRDLGSDMTAVDR